MDENLGTESREVPKCRSLNFNSKSKRAELHVFRLFTRAVAARTIGTARYHEWLQGAPSRSAGHSCWTHVMELPWSSELIEVMVRGSPKSMCCPTVTSEPFFEVFRPAAMPESDPRRCQLAGVITASHLLRVSLSMGINKWHRQENKALFLRRAAKVPHGHILPTYAIARCGILANEMMHWEFVKTCQCTCLDQDMIHAGPVAIACNFS